MTNLRIAKLINKQITMQQIVTRLIKGSKGVICKILKTSNGTGNQNIRKYNSFSAISKFWHSIIPLVFQLKIIEWYYTPM